MSTSMTLSRYKSLKEDVNSPCKLHNYAETSSRTAGKGRGVKAYIQKETEYLY